ncbi:MAG: alpha/beta fold hydrolase [Dehalococcoidia bacterium]
MEHDVRYCTTEDGVSIAYAVTGEGPPLLACPLFIESFALDHMVPAFEQFMHALGRNTRLVRFDMRGTGLSDRNVADFSLAGLIRDLDAVVTATGIESIDVWAPLGSVMRAIGYAAERPQRVRKLVLHEAHASGSGVFAPEAMTGFAALARSDWRAAAHAIAGAGSRWPREHVRGLHMAGEWNLESTNGEMCARFIEALSKTSVASLLQRVAAPTLILHAQRDRLVTTDVAREVAANIANSRLRILDREGLVFATEDTSRETIDAVEEFLYETPRAAEARMVTLGTGARVSVTPRELQVLRLIVAGKSGREIADELVLSPRTVERHVAHLFRKTNTHGRAELVGFAVRRNLV